MIAVHMRRFNQIPEWNVRKYYPSGDFLYHRHYRTTLTTNWLRITWQGDVVMY